MMGPLHAGVPLVWGPGVAGTVMVIRGTDLYYRPDTYLNTSHLPLVGGGRNLGTHPWRAPRTLKLMELLLTSIGRRPEVLCTTTTDHQPFY